MPTRGLSAPEDEIGNEKKEALAATTTTTAGLPGGGHVEPSFVKNSHRRVKKKTWLGRIPVEVAPRNTKAAPAILLSRGLEGESAESEIRSTTRPV
jgi:hypothetical protein